MADSGSNQLINLGEWNHNAEIKRASQDIIKETNRTFLNVENSEDWLDYAPDKGHEEFRSTLAEFLSDQYGSAVNSSDILPTYGATNGLMKVASLFFNSGSLVFCENPVYGPSATLLQDLGMNLIPIQMDKDGIIIEELEKSLEEHLNKHQSKPLKSAYSAMLYLIPVLQNPTGTILSSEKCQRVVQLARKYDLLVACDDVYNMFYCNTDDEQASNLPPPRLFSYDNSAHPEYDIGHVVSIGTASKILVPSLRIGWLEAPSYVIDRIVKSGQNDGGGSPAGYMQGFMTTAIKTGLLKKFLTGSRTFYKNRMKFFVALLKKYFPEYATYSVPKGGFLIWIELPRRISTKRLSEMCAQHGIVFQPGLNYSVDGSMDNCFRLCPSMATEKELEFAFKTIAENIIHLHSLTD